MNVLVACEESQRVCKEFRKLGHEAFSCDLVECSGGHPEWHIKQDVIPLLDGRCKFKTCDNKEHKIIGKWDLIIAHPVCTYLTVCGNRWFNEVKYGKNARERMKERNKSIAFFYKFVMADCDKIAIENPVGVMSSAYRKPDQIIQPYQFGDPYEKKTCLWLKGLSPLIHTKEVKPQERLKFKSGKTAAPLFSYLSNLPKEERSKERSKTFPGIAKAMAEQWGNNL